MPPKTAAKRPRTKGSNEGQHNNQSLVTLTRRNFGICGVEGSDGRFGGTSLVRCKTCEEALISRIEFQHRDVAVSDLAESVTSSRESVFVNCPVIAVFDRLLAPTSSSSSLKGACENESDALFPCLAAAQQKAAVTVAGKEIQAITYGPAITRSYASEAHLYATKDIGESHGVGLLGGIFVDNDNNDHRGDWKSARCGKIDKGKENEASMCGTCRRCGPREDAFFTKRCCDLSNLSCLPSSSAGHSNARSKGGTVDNSIDNNNPASAAYAFVPVGWSVPVPSPPPCAGTSSPDTCAKAVCNSSRVLHTLATKPSTEQQRGGGGGLEEEINTRLDASHSPLSMGGLVVEDASRGSNNTQEDYAIATMTDMPAERAMQLLRLASSAGKRLVLVGVSSPPSHRDQHHRRVVEGLVLEYTDQL